MSLFRTIDIPCPTCRTAVTFELVHSVNADRRPDLRDDILARRFQRSKCSCCGYEFRTEPEFTYLNINRNQWIAVWPSTGIDRWAALETQSQATYDKAFGSLAPSEARELGESLQPRVVFGWISLNEKLLLEAAGLSDVEIELLKVALMRSQEDGPPGENYELRFLGADEHQLVFGWFKCGFEDLDSVLEVPRQALVDLDLASSDWGELRAEVSAGLFVDMRRLLLTATP